MDVLEQSEPPVDTLLHVADLHFWRVTWDVRRLLNKRFLGNLNVALRRAREFPMERATRYIEALVSIPSDTVLFTGDFSSTSLDEEFAAAREFVDRVRAYGKQALILPGNHDVYTYESARARRFEAHFGNLFPFGGYPAREILIGGTPVVLVPTVCPNLVSSKGSITHESIAATVDLVRACEGPCVVAGHYPLLNRTYGHVLTPGRQLRNAEFLRQALGALKRTILYVCGHTHRFSYVEDPDFPGLFHLSTGAFFRNDHKNNCQGEFCEIQVFTDRFRVIRHARFGQWTRTDVKPRPAATAAGVPERSAE